MQTISKDGILNLNQLCDLVLSKLPKVDSSKDYWFIRANRGDFYDSFLLGGYIAIGWNYISLEDLEKLDETSIKAKLKEFDKKMEKPGSAYNQMMRFAHQIKIGDMVVVPSQAPNDLLVGEVKSKAYTASDDKIESASNICPYNKRMRYGELSGLNITEDIDFKNKKIHIQHTFDFRSKKRTTPKTKGSDRVIDVTDAVLKNIQEQIAENIRLGFDTDYIFVNTTGYPTTPERVIGALKRHGEKAGIEKNITTHIFRHSHISLLAELGIPLPAIMDRVGHSDSKTTLEVYSHVTTEMAANLTSRLNEVKLL